LERYICIHGHFYQPPRENPWLESIELQDSSYPYHDWNDRITAESYAPNAASRILYDHSRIVQIANNYSRISFNFGPTLLAWVKPFYPDLYEAILDADRQSQEHFSGHGSAVAQAYNHMIMPLSNRRDKYTQVYWGIRDFEHAFGRRPEGMWLPETAVDIETLEVLAELGIRYTILAPYQGGRVRRLGSRRGNWRDVTKQGIDVTRAYLQKLPSGKEINLFFYNGPVSRGIAFERLLNSGEAFANRLIEAFQEGVEEPQLVHIATDGETYGHHHRHGDMALAYALHYIESNDQARLTNYGEFLEKHPPQFEVQIVENTSWSCAHGIERWRSDCGCNSGGYPDWNQEWRTPLREALDWLRDILAPAYEERAKAYLKDPWGARNDYIDVVLDRSPESRGAFLSKHATRELNREEITTVLKLMELQRHAMLMYTSCGWFFDELSGIETVQVIMYAGRAVHLAAQLFDESHVAAPIAIGGAIPIPRYEYRGPDASGQSGQNIESGFLDMLERAKSNIPEHGDGRRIYEKWVKPAMVDLEFVTAHYAISSLFEGYEEEQHIHSFLMRRQDYQTFESGRTRLVIGRVEATSEVTQESGDFTFGVLHFGDHIVNAGVQEYQGEDAYNSMVSEVTRAFELGDFLEVIRMLDKHLGESTYSLRALFKDEQRTAVSRILETTLAEEESVYRQLYERDYSMMRFLTDLGYPLPKAFLAAAEFIVNTDLRQAISERKVAVEPEAVTGILNDARMWNLDLDAAGLGLLFKQTLEEMASEYAATPDDTTLMQGLNNAVSVAHSLPVEVDVWKVQNIFFRTMLDVYPSFHERATRGDETAGQWVELFTALGDNLSVQVSTNGTA
jgi:alpha-amylase/alpha-mannosidase (GH57 family)